MTQKRSAGACVLASLVVCCIAVGTVPSVQANPITFQVVGTLTGFDGPVLAPLAIGQTYTATYTFNSNAAGTPVFGGGTDYIGAIESASFSIGGYAGTLAMSSQTTIRVLDDFFGFQDQYLAVLGDITFGGFGVINAPAVTSPFFTLFPTRLALVQMDDFSGGMGPPDALSSSSLPLVPPDLSLFTGPFSGVGWSLEFQASDFSAFGRARGSIQSFTVVSQVPEASALATFAAGFVALVALAWSSRRLHSSPAGFGIVSRAL